MKRIIYILSAISSLVMFAGCEATSEDPSKITYFVSFEIQGDQIMLVPVGTGFTDPGVVALEGETDITSTVTASGSVDANEIGVYTITYSAANLDGFSSSVSRTVLVYDPDVTADISGSYTVAAGSYRLTPGTGARVAFSDYGVTLTQRAPGIYYVSDFLGGYYDKRAGYGSAYAMTGYFKLNADNTIEPLSSYVQGWGDSMDEMTNGAYDGETGDVYWEIGYAGTMTFCITLTK
ncbi:MAG: DUF5012 domain-containing protein [Tannerella sp.]|jgi:hypothetical protein|nr:DUF5012 domain-containing protein [Tannerella sp.]